MAKAVLGPSPGEPGHVEYLISSMSDFDSVWVIRKNGTIDCGEEQCAKMEAWFNRNRLLIALTTVVVLDRLCFPLDANAAERQRIALMYYSISTTARTVIQQRLLKLQAGSTP